MKKIALISSLLAFSLFVVSQTNEQQIKQTNYFNQRMAKVEPSVPISDLLKQQMLASFNSLCNQYPDKDNYIKYRVAVRSVIEDTALLYSIFKYELDPKIEIKYKQYKDDYKQKYNLTDEQIMSVSGLIFQQAKQSQFSYYLYPENPEQIENQKKQITEEYKEQIQIKLGLSITNSNPANYCIQRLEQIKSTVGLDNNSIQEIVSNFTKFRSESPEKDNYIIYRLAVRSVIEDTVLLYSVFKNEIDSAVEIKYKKYLSDCKTKYNLTENQLNSVSEVIYLQAKQSQLSNYLYPDNTVESNKYKNAISDKYKDLVLINLTKQGIETVLSNYCTALAFDKNLNLKPEQINSLVINGYNLYKSTRINPDYNKIKIEQLKKTKEVLNNNQYDKYLTLIVSDKANEEVQKTWNEMKQYQLTNELDSTQTFNQLLPYFQERFKIKERYSIIPNKDMEKESQLTALKNNRPNVLRKFEAIKKREQKNTDQNINALKW